MLNLSSIQREYISKVYESLRRKILPAGYLVPDRMYMQFQMGIECISLTITAMEFDAKSILISKYHKLTIDIPLLYK